MKKLGLFEKYLSVWVGTGILAGIAIGSFAPELVKVISEVELGNVNLVVALLIWVMIYPMMIQVDFSY